MIATGETQKRSTHALLLARRRSGGSLAQDLDVPAGERRVLVERGSAHRIELEVGGIDDEIRARELASAPAARVS